MYSFVRKSGTSRYCSRHSGNGDIHTRSLPSWKRVFKTYTRCTAL